MGNREIPFIGRAVISESVPHAHAEIVRGRVFEGAHTFPDVANGGTIEWLIKSTTLRLAISALQIYAPIDDFSVAAFEDPTVDAEGTEVSAVCLNRSDPNTPTGSIFYNPTISADGVELPVTQTEVLTQYFLDTESYYLVRFTNQSSTTTDIEVGMKWHEMELKT